MFKKLWKDPVWSKVIATGLIALIASAGVYLLGWLPTLIDVLAKFWNFVIASS